MLDLVYPFLDKLNVLWLAQSVSPAHEKFISNLIRRKLMCAIDQDIPTPSRDASTFLLYLPEGESQELTLLFLHYILHTRHQKVVYLGSNTALSDLRDACHSLHPDYVYTILHDPLSRLTTQSYIDQAAEILGESTLLLTGPQLFFNPVKLPKNAKMLDGLPDTLQFLDNLQSEHK
ncbi:MAG: hypothetical protein IPL65_10275 [Lewinellaceae bacterium]|nr:hypothetical protein [Lewinellaceae bacterium]